LSKNSHADKLLYDILQLAEKQTEITAAQAAIKDNK